MPTPMIGHRPIAVQPPGQPDADSTVGSARMGLHMTKGGAQPAAAFCAPPTENTPADPAKTRRQEIKEIWQHAAKKARTPQAPATARQQSPFTGHLNSTPPTAMARTKYFQDEAALLTGLPPLAEGETTVFSKDREILAQARNRINAFLPSDFMWINPQKFNELRKFFVESYEKAFLETLDEAAVRVSQQGNNSPTLRTDILHMTFEALSAKFSTKHYDHIDEIPLIFAAMNKLTKTAFFPRGSRSFVTSSTQTSLKTVLNKIRRDATAKISTTAKRLFPVFSLKNYRHAWRASIAERTREAVNSLQAETFSMKADETFKVHQELFLVLWNEEFDKQFKAAGDFHAKKFQGNIKAFKSGVWKTTFVRMAQRFNEMKSANNETSIRFGNMAETLTDLLSKNFRDFEMQFPVETPRSLASLAASSKRPSAKTVPRDIWNQAKSRFSTASTSTTSLPAFSLNSYRQEWQASLSERAKEVANTFHPKTFFMEANRTFDLDKKVFLALWNKQFNETFNAAVDHHAKKFHGDIHAFKSGVREKTFAHMALRFEAILGPTSFLYEKMAKNLTHRLSDDFVEFNMPSVAQVAGGFDR
jgi:hypothetical protein